MTEEEKLENLIEAQLSMQELTFADRARLMSQGALMNFSDEFFAMVRSIGTETYDEAITDERDKLKKAQGKDGSLKYEIGGAMLPLAFAPFTGGATIAPTIARYAIGTGGKLATQGAVQGATSAVGRQEGNIVDRVTDNKADIALSAGGGALLNPLVQKVGGKVVEGITKLAEPLIRKIRSQLAKPIEDELARIARTSGKTIDEIIEEISQGKTIPELRETTAAEVRGFYSKAQDETKSTIADSLISRKESGVIDVFSTLQKDLSSIEKTGNVLKFITNSRNFVKKAASDSYDKIYNKFADFRSNNINLAIEEILQKQPTLRGSLRSLMTGLGKDTPFVVEEGVLKLTKDIDLKTAEKIRGLLFERADKLYKSGNGTLGEVASTLETNLRSIIDKTSPELSMTRNLWRRIMSSRDNFEEGTKIFGKSSDEVEIIFEKIVASGDKQLIESFRSGVASAIRGKREGRTKINFINNLGNLDSKESLILQKIYPDEALDNIIDKINLAKASIMAQGRIMGQSPTAETLAAASRVGTVDDAYALTRVLASGGTDIGAGVQLLKKFIPTKSNALNQDQMQQVAELLVSQNKQLLRDALTNNEARNALIKSINDISDRLIAGGAKATVQETSDLAENTSLITQAFADEINPADYRIIEDLSSNLSPSTKDKILRITIDSGSLVDEDGKFIRTFSPNK
tara:strand:+ start:1155 stop:3224 length:2070 start_codon:yes stop_codon:yes gene_type:complete